MHNWRMGKKRIDDAAGKEAIAASDTPTAVRYLLQVIEEKSPGGAVELRVPPYGAIQCLSGLDHRRGTPPNVIEMEAELFLSLCLGRASWQEAIESGQVLASGSLVAEAAKLFPVLEN